MNHFFSWFTKIRVKSNEELLKPKPKVSPKEHGHSIISTEKMIKLQEHDPRFAGFLQAVKLMENSSDLEEDAQPSDFPSKSTNHTPAETPSMIIGKSNLHKCKPVSETNVVIKGNVDYLQIGPTMFKTKMPPHVQKPNKPIIKSNRSLNHDDFDLVAKNIGKDWKSLARHMHASEADIHRLQYDYYNDGQCEIVYQMLKQWEMQYPDEVTAAELARYLQKVGRSDIAMRLDN